MATLLRMPEVAANATHAVLAGWNKQVGDAVEVGEVLADIESEKAVVELAADEAGTIGHLFVAAGQEVEVGAPIAVLLASGETAADVSALLAASASAIAPEPVQDAAAMVERPAATPTAPAGRLFASPLARRLARERGIDLATCVGSGPNGRIVKRDVEAARPAAAPAAPAVVAVAAAAAYREIPHSAMRRTIAKRLTESKSSIPHFYLTVDCRMDALLALRAGMNAASAAGATRKISVNDFIVRAAALALLEVPEANVGWTESAMRQYASADIAVAVSTDNGLITPIVRNAEAKSLRTISTEIADLAARARAGQLQPDEYQGGSFSISNLGMHGVDEFSAIINPPQAAILAVGATRQMPVVENGALVVGEVMRCTLSVDHRAIDGALAAHWLAAFRRAIESPLALVG
ncbi:pyruvate dehydrogenase complex dihydrolipoamide acetyltransferase [Lysobacter niastensis]|uniref:Acetyltransferase component of pyruvate dehydrogenase complex n=1 Tax=Lysobacter niastensis TaxID=380629 RepID=A0ABS0B579_9GAMM|nr:pyruvate dehydrogenase complex dihydrolipoamide acetyltransferase [Lysobacter niastensis]MBF6023953.1 pyruvate dehydrogenase complex dihydrolipoamide acetyltransferase [Lysobacter niastensis]